jgi:hypothetical protein
MQTFLAYPNFIGSAKVLDIKRLNKQRVENLQIMQTLLRKKVLGTAHFEHTGAFHTAYYDRDHVEVPLEYLDTFDYWTTEQKPVMVMAESSKESWYVEDYENPAWRNHPAVLMWAGYENVLLEYQRAICNEWTDRTFSDSCLAKTEFLYNAVRPLTKAGIPDWIGDEEFHRSHQSNLLRKNHAYYEQFFPDVPDNLPYLWPVSV